MMVTVKEVTSRSELRTFVDFPNKLYRGNEFYVPQLVSADMDTLTPQKNKAFEVCEGKYWMAHDEGGRVVGRVAGIVNHRYNAKVGEKICRFSWIDFIDDRAVSTALLDQVTAYAREMGMNKLEGPMGFLEFDVTGVLVEGFDQLPTAYGKYNAPYYEDHLLAYGFEKGTDYVEYLVSVPEVIPERYHRLSDIVAKKQKVHEAPIRKRTEILPYAGGIFKCMNACYSALHGFSELTPGQCEDLKKQFFSFLNPDFTSIILDEQNEVVAFGICIPSLARALQKTGGRLFPFGFIHVLRALRRNDTLDALLIAIFPEYQSKGLNAMIFDKLAQGIQKNGVHFVESTRELADNVSVQSLWGYFEYKQNKRARTYIKNI